MTKFRSAAYAAVAASTLLGVAMVSPAYAASAAPTEHKDQAVQASRAGADNPDLRLSQDGYNVVRDIRAARISIFNGDIDAAKKFVTMAQGDLAKAKTADVKVKKSDNLDSTQANWIPIDGQLVVADNFVATPEKAKHIAASNEKLKQGKSKEAMEELRLADVNVGFTRLLMPLHETTSQVNLAYDLLKSGDYYQSNMALKAAEDGLNVDTVLLTQAAPSQTQSPHPASPAKSKGS